MNDEDLDVFSEETQEESKGVPLKTAGLILAIIIILLVFIMVFVRSCSITRESGKDRSVQKKSEVVVSKDSKTTTSKEKKSESKSKTSEESKITEESTKSDAPKEGKIEGDKDNPEVSESVESDVVVEENKSLVEVELPELGETLETSVIVAGKGVYKLEGMLYVYSLNLIFPNGEGYDIVKYLCSKKTYDAVSQGETVNVSYQLDESGTISISSISK